MSDFLWSLPSEIQPIVQRHVDFGGHAMSGTSTKRRATRLIAAAGGHFIAGYPQSGSSGYSRYLYATGTSNFHDPRLGGSRDIVH